MGRRLVHAIIRELKHPGWRHPQNVQLIMHGLFVVAIVYAGTRDWMEYVR